MGATPDQLGELLEQQWQPLLLWVGACHGAEEDVVQEAFIRLAGLDVVPANPVAWLYTVTRNLANSARKANQRRMRRQGEVARELGAVEMTDEYGEDRELQVALDCLTDELRAIVVAHVWGELTFDKIGELLAMSSATAWRRYQEALTLLRTKLGDTCPRSMK